ncbi:MAG TPA: choice-of-anchor tandem repeat GloVer-containing protein [Candidatus Dormibacteraeota bacterium]|nr:choice-of-anchor tandem repeat GloVer-containing protein [Candidatus Dormibacteraeota bacterium]
MNLTYVIESRVTRAISLVATFTIGLAALVIAAPSAAQRPAGSGSAGQTQEGAQVKVRHAEIPLSFEPNMGQADGRVKFLSRGSGYELFLTADKAVLLLKKSGANHEIRNPKFSILTQDLSRATAQKQPQDQAVLAMRLVGASRGAIVTGLTELPGASNYFIGNDPANWHTNVPTFAKVRYKNIYPGIDLVYYGNQSQLEYDFVVAPGVDAHRINLSFESRSKLHRSRIDDSGDLVIDVDGREVRFRKPFVYQPASEPGGKTAISAKYVLRANNKIGFELGQYDRSKQLVIDPVLAYSTYIGGNDYDSGFGVAVDASGNIFVAGTTSSTNFPTTNAFQSQNAGFEDIFIAKFNPSGTSLIYSTYLGGHGDDNCENLALDSAGNAYLTGFTASSAFPTKNAIQTKRTGGQNVFLSKLDPSGNLLFSTYYGGSGIDQAYGLAVDSTGIYLAGSTTSTNFPILNAFQSHLASADDSFLAKLATDGSSVIYSTYLGGVGGGSIAYALTVDSSQSPYVSGQTGSPSFPLLNPFQSQKKSPSGSTDVYVTKFTSAGNALVYSTYLGGSGTQSPAGIAVDGAGNAYVTGGTASNDFPTLNPLQPNSAGQYDAFVTKFNSSGGGLIYSTYIGGKANDTSIAIKVDSSGNAYVAGYSLSTNFPTTSNAFQPTSGGNWDATVLELNSAGSGFIYSSYLGGSGLDYSTSIALDSLGNVYVTGGEASTNFPITSNAFQSTYGGGTDDAYLAVVSAVTTFPLTVSVTGTGTVTSNPAGINCGAICSTTFASGTVALTAIAGAGSAFTGWSGACSGTGVCNVNMNAAQSVTATFAAPVFSVVDNFGINSTDPTHPTWPGIIAQGPDGNLYSTTPTALGGSNGAVFNITPSGTVTVLTTFGSGGAPQSGLTLGAPQTGQTLGTDLLFYGTTFGCSVGTNGTVFNVTAGGTLTTLYPFTGGTDGKCPTAPPIQGSDGNLYGTATSSNTSGVYGSVYKLTTAGKFTTFHDFNNTDGAVPDAPLMQANSGSFYGVTESGGSSGGNTGNVFKVTSSGAFNVVSTFTGNNGHNSFAPVVQGSDGNFYGTATQGGASNLGVVFKMTPNGTLTDLYSFTGSGDGVYPYGGLVLASDGNFYGTTSQATASSGCGTIFRISNGGNFQTLVTFPGDGSLGCNPQATLVQHTNGILYGDTNAGGSTIGGVCPAGCGAFFSLNASLAPFIRLLPSPGKVGSTVGILGQGFSNSSVVAFNGVPATAVTLTGTTFFSVTVPAGASTGFVTVTTGATVLSSTVQYVVHNSWSSGATMPIGVAAPATGVINGNIYVVSGFQTSGSAPVSNNQVYNPTTNAWTTAAAIPTQVFAPASAVIGTSLYVIGGFEGSAGTPTNLVQVYNSKTNTWSTKSAMPTARGSATAVVDGSAIYVIGGNGSTLQLNTVEKYVPSTDTWTEEATLLTGKSDLSAALLGANIVGADGYTASGDTGDNESYNVSGNTWTSLTADPNPRNASCSGALTGLLYTAGGLNNANPQVTTPVNESFNANSNKWTSLAAMPTAALWQGSAVSNGLLYCFGGQASNQGSVINNVQIYQP